MRLAFAKIGGEISQQFVIGLANASRQPAVWRKTGIVTARKKGSNGYYSVTDRTVFTLLDVAKEIFNNHLIGVRNMPEEIDTDQPPKQSQR